MQLKLETLSTDTVGSKAKRTTKPREGAEAVEAVFELDCTCKTAAEEQRAATIIADLLLDKAVIVKQATYRPTLPGDQRKGETADAYTKRKVRYEADCVEALRQLKEDAKAGIIRFSILTLGPTEREFKAKRITPEQQRTLDLLAKAEAGDEDAIKALIVKLNLKP